MKKRRELKTQDTWDVKSMYASISHWEKDLQSLKKSNDVKKIIGLKGKIKSAKDVKKLFDLYFSVKRKIEKIYTYAHLRLDEDLTNDQNKKIFDISLAVYFSFEKATAWIQPELLQLPIDEWVKKDILKPFQFLIKKLLRLKPYTLSSEQEQMLAAANKTFQTPHLTFSALNNADMKFDKVKDKKGKKLELTHGSYLIYMRSKDRTLRKNAFTTLLNSFEGFENTYAEILKGQMQNHVFYAETKGYENSLQAALYPNNVDERVYYTLLDTVKKNIKVLHRYSLMKKKILKFKQMHLYDIYAPLVQLDFKKKYNEAKKLVVNSVSLLGEEYQETLQDALNKKRWVDPYENENKRSGAYSSGCYDSYPYILMNYHGDLNDVLTLAHEAGHSMHSFYSHKNQPYHYADYPIFVAEVASTFNEQMLYEDLLKKAKNKKEKLFLLSYQLDGLHATFFRQTLFAQFELMLHEMAEKEIPITPMGLKKVYVDLYKNYYGRGMTIDNEIAIEWARIPHFYYNYYVYQYATGIAAAIHLHKLVKNDISKRKQYLTFISKGGSSYPLDLLKGAGVDLTKSTPIKAAIDHFAYLMDEIENLC